MTLTISFEQIKKWAVYALVAVNIATAGVAVNYVRFRQSTERLFATMEFDINDRLPQIKQRAIARECEKAARAAAAAKAAAEASESSTTTTSLPPKK